MGSITLPMDFDILRPSLSKIVPCTSSLSDFLIPSASKNAWNITAWNLRLSGPHNWITLSQLNLSSDRYPAAKI